MILLNISMFKIQSKMLVLKKFNNSILSYPLINTPNNNIFFKLNLYNIIIMR